MKQKTVVLVHGIWMTGLEMGWLGQYLSRKGYRVHYFRYSSLFVEPEKNAAQLAKFIESLEVDQLDLIGHSLGGIVLLHLLSKKTTVPTGRVVLLGSPVNGSGVARRLAGNPFMRPFLGSTTQKGLLGDAPKWRVDRELGVVAGDRGFGVGSVAGGLSGPADGTVAVSETRLAGASDFCLLPVGHFDMLFSRSVADQVISFLQYGRFNGGLGPIPLVEPVSDTSVE